MSHDDSRPPHKTLLELRPWLVVAAAMLFQAVTCFDEFSLSIQDVPTEVNDHIFHFQLIEAAASPDTLANDPWIPEWGQGFPVLRYYQNLPHLSVRFLHSIIPGVTLFWTFKFVHWLLLILLPLSFALGAKWLGFGKWVAAIASVLSITLSVAPDFPYGFGLQVSSFTWTGGGLFPQLFASVTAPLALGALSRALEHGRGEGVALLFLWLTWMSHLVLGYSICLLGLCLLARSDLARGRSAAALRLLLIYVATALSASSLLLPPVLESPLLSRSIWEDPIYWDSHGMGPVLSALSSGRLLDGGRFPAITLLVGLGTLTTLLLSFRKSSLPHLPRAPSRFVLIAFGLALVVFFGRHALGGLFASILPFSSNLPFHRFICPVQITSIFLGAIGLHALALLLTRIAPSRPVLVGTLVTVLTVPPLLPGLLAQHEAAEKRTTLRRTYLEATRAEWPDVERALAHIEAIRRVRGGRAYAGASWDSGRHYTIGNIPMYLRWGTAGIPAISYMFHTMGRMSDLETSFSPWRKDHADLFDVHVMMTDRAENLPPFATIEHRFGRHFVASVDNEGPLGLVRSRYAIDTRHMTPTSRYEFGKAFIESRWHSLDEFPRILWREDDVPLAHETAWTTPTSFPQLPDSHPVRGQIELLSERDDRLEARIRLEEPAVLLVRKTFHPAWQAEVDGLPSAIHMLAPSFIGVPISPGVHTISLRYEGSLWISILWWLGPVIVLSLLLRDWLRRRTESQPASIAD